MIYYYFIKILETMVESKGKMTFGITNAHAAGIDVGSRFHCVSVGEGKEDCREFGVFTEDLHALCEWLKSKGVQSVAMESTGFYWKQLFLMIQSDDPILRNGSVFDKCRLYQKYPWQKAIRHGRQPVDMENA